jgi:hypothetical protein
VGLPKPVGNKPLLVLPEEPVLEAPRSLCVSGRKLMTSSAFTIATAIATMNGTAGPSGDSKPPIAGPTTKPKPIAAPIMPIPRALPSGGVTSATTACADPILEAPIPPIKRAISKTTSDPARPESAKEKASINNDTTMIGLRPYRSERAPRIGVKMNCARA